MSTIKTRKQPQARIGDISYAAQLTDKNPRSIRVLSKREVLDRLGVTFPTIWKWMRAGKFPRARELGPGKSCWVESEINEWILTRPIRRLKGDEQAA
jgi:prophage regulatory protein